MAMKTTTKTKTRVAAGACSAGNRKKNKNKKKRPGMGMSRRHPRLHTLPSRRFSGAAACLLVLVHRYVCMHICIHPSMCIYRSMYECRAWRPGTPLQSRHMDYTLLCPALPCPALTTLLYPHYHSTTTITPPPLPLSIPPLTAASASSPQSCRPRRKHRRNPSLVASCVPWQSQHQGTWLPLPHLSRRHGLSHCYSCYPANSLAPISCTPPAIPAKPSSIVTLQLCPHVQTWPSS